MKSVLRVLVVVGLAATVAACSKTTTEAGSSGLSGTLASSSASAGASAGPTVAPTPTKTKSGSGSGSGSTASPSPSVSSPSPAGSGGGVIKGGGSLDYKVVAQGNCFWKLYDDAGSKEVQIGAQFEATVNRRLPRAGTVPMTVTNSVDLDNASGSAPLGSPVSWSIGHELVSQNEFGGKTVTLKATITPAGTDAIASDNVATVTVSVPAGSPPSAAATPLAC